MDVSMVAVVEAVTEGFSLFFSFCDDCKNFMFVKTSVVFNALLFSCFASRKGEMYIFLYNKPAFVRCWLTWPWCAELLQVSSL